MSSAPEKVPVGTGAYMLAASVLDSFDPAAIQPCIIGNVESHDYDALLATAVLTQTGPTNFEWRLSDHVRKAGLRVLADHGMLQHALDVNPDRSQNIYQETFEHYIRGDAPPLGAQSLEQLQASLQAVQLLSGVVPAATLPNEVTITAMVQKEAFLQQFRILADKHFFGRSKELEQLTAFVDALPVSGYNRLRRAVIGFASNQLGMESFVRTPPLLIQGPGGIGKSSFLAKFLVQHADQRVEGSLLFAYVDFDRGAIWPDEPLTVLADIASQFSTQTIGHADELVLLQQRINDKLSVSVNYENDFDSETLGSLSSSDIRQQHFLKHFTELTERIFPQGRHTTVLLVFDSFEEVTQRGDSHVLVLFRFLNQLQLAVPRLRIVLSGRGALRGGVEHKRLDLRPLAPAVTRNVLESYGITDTEIMDCIIDRVGGHPLSIRLAAQLVATTQRDAALMNAKPRWQDLFWTKLDARLDEGVLFTRIVDHIDDTEVKKLISPGFAVRVLTPDLILNVLKDACQLNASTVGEAKDLFCRLASYSSLVSQRSQWQLKHRADVRALILDSLRRTQPDMCKQIWSAGVLYYQNKSGIHHRAEEMYCRLMLGQRPEEMNDRWLPGVEKLLGSAHDELPRAGADFLRYKLISGGAGSTKTHRPDTDAMVMYQAEEMKYLLSRGDASAALAVPAVLPEPGSHPLHPLYSLTARAYAQSGAFVRAYAMAHAGLESLDREFQTETSSYLDLLLLAAQMSLDECLYGDLGVKRSNRIARMSVEQLWRWYRAVPRGRATRYRRLRVCVYVLELIKLDTSSGQAGLSRANLLPKCIATALHLLRKIVTFQDELNGMFMLRTFALLAVEPPIRTELRTLLAFEPVRAALLDGFAKHFEANQFSFDSYDSDPNGKVRELFDYVTGKENVATLRATLESAEYSEADFVSFAQSIALEFAQRDSARRVRAPSF